MRYRLSCAAALSAAALAVGVAHADPAVPQPGSGCPAELADAMTLLADGQTYAACRPVPDGYAWAAVQTPFDPNDTWLSYGPPIILHGQGMRNPNVTSGAWTASPLDPQTVCRAEQQTVVEAGVLSPPQVAEGAQGEGLSLRLSPRLFYLTLSGDCAWTRDD